MAEGKQTIKATFAGVSFGKDAARLGVHVERTDLPLETSVGLLVNSRLRIEAKAETEPELFDSTAPTIVGIADSRRLSVGHDSYSFSLTFSREDVDADTMAMFAGKTGKFSAERMSDIPERSTSDENE